MQSVKALARLLDNKYKNIFFIIYFFIIFTQRAKINTNTNYIGKKSIYMS